MKESFFAWMAFFCLFVCGAPGVLNYFCWRILSGEAYCWSIGASCVKSNDKNVDNLVLHFPVAVDYEILSLVSLE